MNDAEAKTICLNAFRMPGLATTIEAKVGKSMLKAERKAGHKSKFPASAKLPFGGAVSTPEERLLRVLELVDALKGSKPKNITKLCKELSCSKHIARNRASQAIEMGLAKRFLRHDKGLKRRIYLYKAIKGGVAA
jgi:hypothetical protein